MEDEIRYYEELKSKTEREISDLWEVGKKSKAKERKLHEINLILIGLNDKKIMDELTRKNRYYEQLLETNNISYLH